jgi:hypothetical protein
VGALATRKRIGKTTRFRIFERDRFRCQYCGRTPPSIVLEIDHIAPISKGGESGDENLVTSCFECNRGKRDHSLDPARMPRDYVAMADDAEVRAQQLASYREHLEQLRAEMEAAVDFVGEAFWGKGSTWDYEDDEFDDCGVERRRVRRFIEILGLGEVEEAARIARIRLPGERQWYARFKYFCGVCWKKREQQRAGVKDA